MLRDVVLPAARPDEVFLYATPLNVNTLRRPQSVGMLLADWAVKAGKADELKQAISARKGPRDGRAAARDPLGPARPCDERPGRDQRGAQGHRGAFEDGHVAQHRRSGLPRRDTGTDRPQPELATAAIGVLDSAAKGMETANQPEPLASLLLILARRQFELGDAAGGRKRLDAYLAAMDKSTIRYGGDYPLYLRKQQLHRVAAELVRAGLWSDALETLGRFVDAPAYSGGDPPVDDVLVPVVAPARRQSGQGAV